MDFHSARNQIQSREASAAKEANRLKVGESVLSYDQDRKGAVVLSVDKKNLEIVLDLLDFTRRSGKTVPIVATFVPDFEDKGSWVSKESFESRWGKAPLRICFDMKPIMFGSTALGPDFGGGS